VEYEDTITIPTPEGIELEYTLAGVGSRFVAELVDVLLRLAVLGALVAVIAVVGGGPGAVVIAIIAQFLAWFVYDIVFEVWGAGRTPGKRWSGLRVVMAGGQPIRVGSSAVRTLLRLIDQWGTLGVAGTISVLATRRNQRLGDLAAGTIVVREARAGAGTFRQLSQPALAPMIADLDVTAVSASELSAVRDFLGRRDTLAPGARPRVAQALADRLAGKIGGLPPGDTSPERLLEIVAAAKDASRYGPPQP
jgi:uncharacterized RDD family membrane protein YckC